MLRILRLMTFLLLTVQICGADDGCRNCHENRQTMEALGYGHFTVTQQEVEAQSGMQASCVGCHLGDPTAAGKEKAHQGLARLLVTRKKGMATAGAPRVSPLEFGTSPIDRIFLNTVKDGKQVKDSSVIAISWHDKNSQTLTQDFDVMRKTCGACHEQEFAEFSKSTMARNAKQSQYKSWIDDKRGPHNCGAWFDGNFDRIQGNTAVAMTQAGNALNQKACNTCHVGCLDCHFNPQPKSAADLRMGSHSFSKTPPALSCYGNGRASICHAGPEDRRRGAGYFGGVFSFPEGNDPDVHVKAKVVCLDCHESSKQNKAIGHAMVKRQATASCLRCHAAAVQSHLTSLHKNLACESCHIQSVAGYQGTYWGPGNIAGAATPFFKFKAYYGIMPEPILIRDQKGRWIPVKPFPMAVMNQKEAPFSPGLHWRYSADLPDLQRTDDAWAYVGLLGGLPENNKALLWIQMDKMSHKLGKSRSCDSCHGSSDGSQRQAVTWEYSDPGALPFSGGHSVVGDKTGLYIRDMRSEKIEPEQGYPISAFAPWVYLKDKWQVRGDFSIPVIRDRKAYEAMKGDSESGRGSGVLHSRQRP
jgi:hypothetical protein